MALHYTTSEDIVPHYMLGLADKVHTQGGAGNGGLGSNTLSPSTYQQYYKSRHCSEQLSKAAGYIEDVGVRELVAVREPVGGLELVGVLEEVCFAEGQALGWVLV
jgi:hypothetical protein